MLMYISHQKGTQRRIEAIQGTHCTLYDTGYVVGGKPVYRVYDDRHIGAIAEIYTYPLTGSIKVEVLPAFSEHADKLKWIAERYMGKA